MRGGIISLAIIACLFPAMGLAGCCSEQCDPTTWRKGSMDGMGRGGYDYFGVGYEAPWDMTPEQVCDCLRDYLRSHVGKDNTLMDGGRHSLEGGMREVDFWAFAYARLVDYDLVFRAGPNWPQRDELIRAMLEHPRPSPQLIKRHYFTIFVEMAVDRQYLACEVFGACSDAAQLRRSWPEIRAVEIALRDRMSEYLALLDEEGRSIFIYPFNKIIASLNGVIEAGDSDAWDDAEKVSNIRKHMDRILRYYRALSQTFSAEMEFLPEVDE